MPFCQWLIPFSLSLLSSHAGRARITGSQMRRVDAIIKSRSAMPEKQSAGAAACHPNSLLRHLPLSPLEAIFPAPEPTAGLGHWKVGTNTVEKLAGLLARFRFADFGIGQCHFPRPRRLETQNLPSFGSRAQSRPHKEWDVTTCLGRKKAKAAEKSTAYLGPLDCIGCL